MEHVLIEGSFLNCCFLSKVVNISFSSYGVRPTRSVVLDALPVKLMYLLPSFRYLILNTYPLSQSLQRDFLTKQDLILAEKFIDAVDFTHHHTVFRIMVAPRMLSISVQTRIN